MTEYKLYFDEENNKFVAVNSETGIIKELIDKKMVSVKKSSKKKDEDPTPKVILEANKYTLNTAALELLKVDAGDRVLIHYVHGDPVIGAPAAFGLDADSGNKLTKSGTVACRGKANEVLSKYGTVFELIETDRDGQFKLKGDAPEIPTSTEEIENPDIIDDIDDLIEEDVDNTNSTFNFNL